MFKNECCVCLEEKEIVKIRCAHPICYKCLSLLKKKICPLCRESLPEENYKNFIIYFISLFGILLTIYLEYNYKDNYTNRRYLITVCDLL